MAYRDNRRVSRAEIDDILSSDCNDDAWEKQAGNILDQDNFEPRKKRDKKDEKESSKTTTFTLHLAFAEHSNPHALVAGYRRLKERYNKGRLIPDNNIPKTSSALIKLSETSKSVFENPYTVRIELLQQIMPVRPYDKNGKLLPSSKDQYKAQISGKDEPPKKQMRGARAGDTIRIYTNDEFLLNLETNVDPLADEALAQLKKMQERITVEILPAIGDSATMFMQNAESMLKERLNAVKTEKKNKKDKGNYLPHKRNLDFH